MVNHPFASRLLLLLGLVTLALATTLPRSGDDDYEGPESFDDNDDFRPWETIPQSVSSELAAARLESRIERAHGILGCLAFGFVFPSGGIIIRVLPFRFTVWLHAAWQLMGWTMALATLGMGVWMAEGEEYIETYHAIIGIVAISCVSLQPVTGLIHHWMFKKLGRRTVWSGVHIWWGILVVTLGAINGGFGLELNGADRKYMIVYGVLAGLLWVVWMVVSFVSRLCWSRRGKDEGRTVTEGSERRLREKTETTAHRDESV